MFSARIIANRESASIQARGLSYRSHVAIISQALGTIVARVRGSHLYTTSIWKDKKGQYVDDCDCPYGATCKHTIALAYVIEANPQLCALLDGREEDVQEAEIVQEKKTAQEQERMNIESWFQALRQLKPTKSEEQESKTEGVYYQLLVDTDKSWRNEKPKDFYLAIRAGRYKVAKSGSVSFGNPQDVTGLLQRDPAYLTDRDKKILHIVANCDSHYYMGGYFDSRVRLDKFALEELRTLLPHMPMVLSENQKPIVFFPETVSFKMQGVVMEQGLVWKPQLVVRDQKINHAKIAVVFSYDPPIVSTEETILYFLDSNFSAKIIKNILQAPFIPKNDLEKPEMITGLIEASQYTPIMLPQPWEENAQVGICQPVVIINTKTAPWQIDLLFQYNTRRFHSFESSQLYAIDNTLYKRNREQEAVVLAEFQNIFHLSEVKTLPYELSHQQQQMLSTELIQKFPLHWEVWLNKEEQKINRTDKQIHVNQTSTINWLDISGDITFDDATLSIIDILEQLMDDAPLVSVKNSLYIFDQESIKKLKKLQQLYDPKEKTVRLHRTQLGVLESLDDIVEKNNLHESWQKSLQAVRTFKRLTTAPLPKNFHATVRPYQKQGVNWLHFLRDFQFGGILADDMGLGKTLQTLTLLAYVYQTTKKLPPSLIIAPTSVVQNWKREIEKFTLSLKIHVYLGKDRHFPRKNKKTDVLLTSYAILWRDREKFAKEAFYYVILDEAQYIKNHTAQTSQTARNLKSEYRLSLTGTPIENNLLELWSQFAFVNPGMFGSLENFKQRFVIPIEKDADEKAKIHLQQLIKPFILRRTKKQVLKELPPKIEQTIWCEMSEEQTRLYEALKSYYQVKVFSLIDREGIEKSQIQILEALLRLRQICCHPRLLKLHERESFPSLPKTLRNIHDSAKLNETIALIETALQENHKILLFSQFTSMLDIIKETLEKKQIVPLLLTGQTNNRQELIDTFQTSNKHAIFLLSLKAGGTGLNLTAADYVIHYDPWWNPAVEMQATDRAHRIGQGKTVSVYKMLVKNTIEEKIQQLQEKKRGLIDDIITATAGGKRLTKDDLLFLFG